MVHPFVRKLHHGAMLTAEDENLLIELVRSERTVGAGLDIVREGSEPHSLPLIASGWASRYRVLQSGKRQVISLILPGDLCEPFGLLPRFSDVAVGALTPVKVVWVPLASISRAVARSVRIEEALWWDLLVSSAIEREHIVSLGRRTAVERIAHLLCELRVRLEMVGLVDGASYELPVTQSDLGDLLGLSTVHVNRSLQELRKQKLISLKGGQVILHREAELRELSFFEAEFIRLAKPRKTSHAAPDLDVRRR